MLLTLFYMFFTYKLKYRSSIKAKVRKIFKEGENSVLLCNEPVHIRDEKEVSVFPPFHSSLSPAVCMDDFKYVNIEEMLWILGDRELFSVYPQVRIFLQCWKVFPYGKGTYPFFENNTFEKKINNSERTQYFFVQAERDWCDLPISSNLIKLHDYGLIVAWGEEKNNLYFIVETDIDHITDFFIMVMQGKYYINNGLKLLRVLSFLPADDPMRPCEKTYLKGHKVFGLDFNEPTIRQNNDKVEGRKEISFPLLPKKVDSSQLSKKDGLSSSSQKDDFPSCLKDDLSAPLQKEDLSPSSDDDDSEDEFSNDSAESAEIYMYTSKKELEEFTSDEERLFKKHIQEVRPKSPKKKPPNPLIRFNFMIYIYAERKEDLDNLKDMLENVLQNPYRYCVFELTKEDIDTRIWINHVGLVIVVGKLDAKFINKLVVRVTKGGKVLALCSNMLQTLLPIFKTAEVQENKIVKFSYDKYKNIDLVHDLYCYQASPIHARFSQENEETRAPELKLPATIELKDELEESHTFHVTELGREETWQTPSILLVTQPETYGTIIFSQIHLERDPTKFPNGEKSVIALEKSNEARLNIVRDLFEKQFEMDLDHERIEYTTGYFLGLVEAKQKMVKNLKDKITADEILIMPKLKIQFCTSRTPEIPASSTFLPIMMYMGPDRFNSVSYFNKLRTKSIGRLVIFSEVVMSSMYVIGTKLEHGLAVITRQQTRGHGRHQNKTWLGPIGCVMFTVQVHIPKNSYLGGHITLLQHIATVAIIKAVRQKPGYENIPLRVKWPNDVYAYKKIKIGGTIVTTQLEDSMYICNIGVGVNLDNYWPTTCINDLIERYNEKKWNEVDIGPEGPLKLLVYEEFIASVFNQIEILINKIEMDNDSTFFRDVYCSYWIHEHKKVRVSMGDESNKSCKGRIVGIDEDGFLVVQKRTGEKHTVHPDGNSFDSLCGLIFSRKKKVIQ